MSATPRRHRRISDPRRRRQGEGAESRRRERDRLRCRRTGLPDARHIVVEAAVATCRDPKTTATRPPPGCPELARGDSGQDEARDSAATRRPPPSLGHQRREAHRATMRRGAAEPGDEVLVPAPYWTRTPSRSPSPAPVRLVIDTDARPSCRGNDHQLDATLTPNTKALLFVSPTTPRRRLPGGDAPRSANGPLERHLARHRRDLRTPHLRRGSRVHVDATIVPELGRTACIVSTASPRPAR